MAKYRVETSLQAEGRQIFEPNAPDISQAGKAYEGIGNAVTLTASMIGKHVQQQRKVALDLEANFNTLTAQREMGLNLLQLKEKPVITEKDISEFNKTNQQIGVEILNNTSDENRNAVSKLLMQETVKGELSAYKYMYEASQRQIKQSAAVTIYEGSKQLEEYAINGDEESFINNFNQIDSTQKSLLEAGYISSEAYSKTRDDLIQIGINGKLQNGYEKVIAEKGERAGAQFIDSFWKKESHLTNTQKTNALEALLDVRKKNETASLQVSQAGFRDAMEFVTREQGGPRNENELNAYIDSLADKGYPLNEYQAYKTQQAFRNKKKTTDKRLEKNNTITRLIADADVDGLLNESSRDVDNNYIDTKKYILQQSEQEKANAETPAQKILAERQNWMIGATIAAQTPVAINQWQKEIHSQLLSDSPADILNAVSGYNYVEDFNKRGTEGISAKDKAFIGAITNDLNTTTLTPDEIIKKYQDSILRVDDKVRENRKKEYRDFIKEHPDIGNEIAKRAFGTKIKNTLKQPAAELYAAAQNAFEREYSLTGDENQAITNAVSYLKDNGGESLFAPKGEPVWNPPEHLPYFDFGNIVRNQATKYLKEAVNLSQSHPDRLPYSLAWSKKMPDFPDEISEEELFEGKFDKGEWWLNVNGQDRRVYFISPNYNQANSFSETRYQVMYEKDGYLQNLLTISPNLSPTGETELGANIGMMTFRGPLELTPNVIERMQQEKAVSSRNRYINKEVGKQFPTELPTEEGPDLAKYLHKDSTKERFEEEKNKDILKKLLEEKNKSLPKRIEKEKLRRQQEKVQQIISESNTP